MAGFNKELLEQIWISAGGKKSAAPMAAAIALAESGGSVRSENHNTNGSIDRGLWQINSIHGSQSTFDVAGNAKAAVAISKNGTDWTPWATYNEGKYKQFLGGGSGDKLGIVKLGESLAGGAVKEFNNVKNAVTAIPKGIDAVGKGIESIASVINFIGSPGGTARILKVVGGGVLILIAGNELVKVGGESTAAGPFKRAATTATKVAEIAPK